MFSYPIKTITILLPISTTIFLAFPLDTTDEIFMLSPKVSPSSDVPNPMSSPLFKGIHPTILRPFFNFFPSLWDPSISIQSFDYFSHLKENTLILVSILNSAPFICSPFSETFGKLLYTLLFPIPLFQFFFKPTVFQLSTPSIPLKVLKVIKDLHVINFSSQFPGLSLLALTQQFWNRGDFCTWSTKCLKTFLVVTIQGIWPKNSLAPNANSTKAEKPQPASPNKQYIFCIWISGYHILLTFLLLHCMLLLSVCC